MTNFDLIMHLVPKELGNTLYMVFFSVCLSFIFGLPLGILLYLTDNGAQRFFYQTLGIIVNIGRSIPFAILMICVIPFTRLIIGTSLGTTASIIPLTLAAIPLIARLIEMSLKETSKELIEAARIMGSSTSQLISKVLLPEAYPSIIQAITLTSVNLIGYSAMAGLVGGGGLGKIAIQYGYQRFNGTLMLVTLALLLILVEATQWIGNSMAKIILKKRGQI